MANFFGTDGVRGIFNQNLTIELAQHIGNALAQKINKPKVLIGSDTRTSSDILKCALSSGVMLGGGSVIDTGIVPTPCISYLTKLRKFDYGVMISASHNPPMYNGIKIFKSNGQKLDEGEEEELEELFSCQKDYGSYGTYRQINLSNIYEAYLESTANIDLSRYTICLDCSNGASFRIAKKIFKKLGAKVFTTACKNLGEKINENCGSLHIENIISLVKRKHADYGFAFDGDADRLIAVDKNLEVYDGDKVLYILANMLKSEGLLYADTVVGTSHTNSGIVSALNKNKINLIRTDIGDKYVIEAMRKMNLSLGGEQSGHIIIGNYMSTGDGILTALQLCKAITNSNKSLAELFDAQLFPQVNVDVVVKDKIKVINNEKLHELIQSITSLLSARVLVRASGTENKIRIMVEHQSLAKAKRYAREIQAYVEKI